MVEKLIKELIESEAALDLADYICVWTLKRWLELVTSDESVLPEDIAFNKEMEMHLRSVIAYGSPPDDRLD